jgi:hypothetical protein
MEIVPPAGWSPEAELDALVKFDAPIRYEYSEFDAMLVNADPDVHLPDVGEGKFEVEAPPSATVYVSFVNRHVTRVVLTSIRASFRGPVEPDAGDAPEPEPPDDDQGDPGAAQDELSTTVSEAGCGCRRGRPARAAGWLSLLMLLLIPRGGSAAARTRSRSGCCPRTRSCRAVSR